MTYFINDTGAITRSLLAYGEWAENELTFIKKLIPAGSLVVDVGGYIGTHTLAFSRFVGSRGRVLTFEPQNETFKILRKNVADNQIDNVRLIHAAAADRSGTLIAPSVNPARPASFGSAALRPTSIDAFTEFAGKGAESGASAIFRVATVDSMDLPECALIKIDAEGYESLVLEGAEKTISRLSPVVYAECNSVDQGMAILETLRRYGYLIRMHVVDGFNPDNFLENSENIFGSAREVALVGLSRNQVSIFDTIEPRRCELILRIERADDIVLGMLNKPQYLGEVLESSAAALSGGGAWLGTGWRRVSTTGSLADMTDHEDSGSSAQVGEYDNMLHMAQRDALAAKAALEEAAQTVEALKRETLEASAERDSVRVIADNARKAAKIVQVELDQVKRAHAQVLRDIEAFKSKADLAMSQAHFAREAADRAEAMNKTLLDQKRELTRQLAGVQADLVGTRAEVTRLLAQAQGLRVQIEELQGQVGQQQDGIAQQQALLEAIRHSTSWRLTRPLRAVGRQLGRR